MKRRNMIWQSAAVFLLLLFAACEHKELCYDHSHTVELQVVFDWKKAPDASPETMRLYLFPMKGGKPQVYEFPDARGGRISVPMGDYKALCVNSDTEKIQYRNIDSFETFEAYAAEGISGTTSSTIPYRQGNADEPIVKSPDHLYSDRLEEVTVEYAKENQTITLYPALSVCRYRIEIRNVANLKYIAPENVSGTLSGMSDGLWVGRNELTPDPVTISFGMQSDGTSTLTAEFLTFGQIGSLGPSHQLAVYVIMSDGSKTYYTFDVSKQVDNAADPRDVYILLDGLSLPKPIVNGGGFHPTVDEWQHVHIELPM